jgi:hypothetical protein
MNSTSNNIFNRSSTSSSNIFGVGNNSTLSFRNADFSEFREDMKFGYIAKTRIDDMFDDFYMKYHSEECPNVQEEIEKLKNFHVEFGQHWGPDRHKLKPMKALSPKKDGSKGGSVFLT